MPNASAAQESRSVCYVALRSGSLENSDNSSEALDGPYDDVRSSVTMTNVFSDESGVKVTGDAGLGVKHYRCPEVLVQSRASRQHQCWHETFCSSRLDTLRSALAPGSEGALWIAMQSDIKPEELVLFTNQVPVQRDLV